MGFSVKYHINNKGEPGICEATITCPFGNFDGHYPDTDTARKSYENFMNNITQPNKSVRFDIFISSPEKHAFTKADCAHLAKTLYKSANLPIYYLGDKVSKEGLVEDRNWSHFVNKLPDGRYIDVEGIWTEKELLKRWQVDELGSGWKPDSINPTEVTDYRKMGVVSQMFPHIKPTVIVKKLNNFIPVWKDLIKI